MTSMERTLPFKFLGERVGGFNFEGRPSMYANGKQRFMDGSNKIYACELGRLARELMAATPMLLRRLESLILLCCSYASQAKPGDHH